MRALIACLPTIPLDPEPEAEPAAELAEAAPDEALAPEPEPSPEETLGALLAAAEARAREEERARAEASLARAMADASAAAAARLAEARAEWARAEGEAMARAVADGLAALEGRIADCVARALAPVLAEAARSRAVEDLARALEALLRADPATPIAVGGPADLAEALVARLGAAGAAARVVPGEGAELVVEAGGARIETQIEEWAARLRAAAA